MADFKAKMAERVAASVHSGTPSKEGGIAPSFHGDFECKGPEGLKWRDHFDNVVVNEGKKHLLARFFASYTNTTAGAFLHLHSATTASDHVWTNISASAVHSYGTAVPLITFATNTSTGTGGNLLTATAAYSFTASTQTVSGAAVVLYTTNTLNSASTAGVLEYSEGHFAASRLVQSGDTLNVTLTVSFA